MAGRKTPMSFEEIRRFLDGLLGDDLHAKRVLSLAGATLGVIQTASLAIGVIGRGLALARGRLTKHAIKQVDRMLSNPGIDSPHPGRPQGGPLSDRRPDYCSAHENQPRSCRDPEKPRNIKAEEAAHSHRAAAGQRRLIDTRPDSVSTIHRKIDRLSSRLPHDREPGLRHLAVSGPGFPARHRDDQQPAKTNASRRQW